MGLRLFFLPNFPGATFIQGATFIPDSRVYELPIDQANTTQANPKPTQNLLNQFKTN